MRGRATAEDASVSRWVFDGVPTPALVVDLDVFEANLDEMVRVVRESHVELLPHAKTHRMLEAARMQIAHGADGLCVAKLGEAEEFVAAGAERIFVANPIVGDDKFSRAVALGERVDLTLATDTVAAAEAMGAYFAARGAVAHVMLAVDSGLGREGVAFQSAADIATEVASLPGIQLDGIYTHEGSVYGAVDRDDLVARSIEAAEKMVAIAEEIRARGIPITHVSMGASASARLVAGVAGVTQIRPGIYAFNDVGQIAIGNASLDTAAVRVIATVVSHPEPGRACIDAGAKALSTDLVPAAAHREEFPGHGLIVDAPGWVIERMSEEHGWLRWHGEGMPEPLPVGTKLQIVPNHVCMAFAMLRRAYVVRNGVHVGTWDGLGPGASE